MLVKDLWLIHDVDDDDDHDYHILLQDDSSSEGKLYILTSGNDSLIL